MSRPLTPGVEIVCPVCAKTFTVLWQRRHTQRYCSPTCRTNKFWLKVQKSPTPDGCWIYTGRTNEHGYGRIKNASYGQVYVHRLSYEMHVGPIPDGLFVLHKCDNPPCARPDHLFLGTHERNMQDMTEKRRVSHGSERPLAKLTDDKVIEIRNRHAKGGITQHELGLEYGVCSSIINTIIRRKRWKHVA